MIRAFDTRLRPLPTPGWGILTPEGYATFGDAFPDGLVPLESITPIQPRESTAPLCLIVDGAKLSDDQVQRLAERLQHIWREELTSVDEAAAYIRNGLPLRTTWFSVVTTADYTRGS